MVGQVVKKLCLEAQAAHLFLLGPNAPPPPILCSVVKVGCTWYTTFLTLYRRGGSNVYPQSMSKNSNYIKFCQLKIFNFCTIGKFYLSYIYCKIRSFYICDTGASPMHVSGHHISKAVSVQNLSKSISP